jgi:hypothetical protein
MKENLKKDRLAWMDAKWVKSWQAKLLHKERYGKASESIYERS